MLRTITVSTATELYAALAKATGGETIQLAGGDYGKLALNAKSGFDFTFPSNVTITSADPGNPAVFTGADVRGASNLTMDGVTFDYTFAPGDNKNGRPFNFAGCDNIAIRNSTFDGDLASGQSTVDNGFGYGIGLSIRGSTGVVVDNNEFFDFYRGTSISTSSNVAVTRNDIHDLRMDGMNFAQVKGVRIEDNYIHDFRGSPTSGDHSDFIQFWTEGTTARSENIVIRGNRLDIGNGSLSQSIFIRNEAVDRGVGGPAMFYRNILIEENIIVNGQTHGIAVGQTNGLIIRNNSVLHADGDTPDGRDAPVEIPRISVHSNATGVVIVNNATGGILGWNSQTGWTVRNNAFVQDQNSQSPGYYGDVFINSSLQLINGVHDFRAVEGGMLDRLLAGATETRDSTPVGVKALFNISQDDSNSASRLFDASMSATDLDDLPRGTVFMWNFGDGTSAKGTVVSHAFTTGGTYNVSLTILQPDGSVSAIKLPVSIAGPEILSMTSGGQFVAYDAGKEIALGGTRALTGADADGLQLGGSGVAASVKRQYVDDILKADDFSIDLTLKADVRNTGGEVFRLHGSFITSVDSRGEMTFRAFTTTGEVKVVTTGAHISDTLEHDISIRLTDGRLQVVVDGRILGSAVMTGTLQSDGTHDLVFGNLWGRPNFNGDLRAFEITRDADEFRPVAETVVLEDLTDTAPSAAETSADAGMFQAGSDMVPATLGDVLLSDVVSKVKAAKLSLDDESSPTDTPLGDTPLGDRFEFLAHHIADNPMI